MYCPNCGTKLANDAKFCGNCGYNLRTAVQPAARVRDNDHTLIVIIEVCMILGCVYRGIGGFLVPLAWCIPMTVSFFRSVRNGTPTSTAFKVCTLIFVSLVAGILLLVMDDSYATHDVGYNPERY